MKKLFIYNEKSKLYYKKQIKLAFNELSKTNKNCAILNHDNINLKKLKNYDVIISNKLSEENLMLTKKLKIVTFIIDDISPNIDGADIQIDALTKEKNITFTGKDYAIKKSNIFYFSQIFNIISFLEWDTKFWNFPVAVILSRKITKNIMEKVKSFVAKNKIRLVQYLCDCHDQNSVKIAEKNNFEFKDIRLTLEKDLSLFKYIKTKDNKFFRNAVKKDIPKLKEIASKLYLDSRYHFDKNFIKKKIELFYSEWVSKAVQKKYDDDCLIYLQNSQPVAFCTLKYSNKDLAIISLFGVDKKFSGKGIGKKLLGQVMQYLKYKKFSKVIVVTQGRNYSAQRLYQSAGFLTLKTELWYHKWIKKND